MLKMKSLKKVTASILSVLISFSAVSEAAETTVDSNPNFCYKIVDEKNAVLTEFKSSKLKNLSDPEGYNIIEIADDASKTEVYNRSDVINFWATVVLTAPTIVVPAFMFDNPENPPKVGKFKRNNVISGITSVNLPHCKRVGKRAFSCCNKLETVNLPECTTLERDSLMGCIMVNKLNVPKCLTLSSPFGIYGNHSAKGSLKELNAEQCTKIEKGSFKGFMKLEIANIPNVTYVGSECFDYCKSLKELDLNKCKIIPERCFQRCFGLRTILLNSCTEIKKNAFKKCESLQNMNLPNCTKIGPDAFEGCKNLCKLSAPKLTSISKNAFTSLSEVYIPACKYVGEGTFNNCRNLKKITVSRDCKFEGSSLPYDKVLNNELEIVRV